MYWFSKLYVCLQGEIYYYYLLDKFISVIIYQIYLSYIIIISFFLFQPEGRSTIPILVILIDCLPFHKFPKCFHPCVTFDLFNIGVSEASFCFLSLYHTLYNNIMQFFWVPQDMSNHFPTPCFIASISVRFSFIVLSTSLFVFLFTQLILSIRLQHHKSIAPSFLFLASFMTYVSLICVVTLRTYVLMSLLFILSCIFLEVSNLCYLLKAVFANAIRCVISLLFLPLDVILLSRYTISSTYSNFVQFMYP